MDGGVVLDVQRGLVQLADGGMEPIVGGCWMSTEKCIAVANAVVQNPPPQAVASLVVGFVLGIVLAVAVTR